MTVIELIEGDESKVEEFAGGLFAACLAAMERAGFEVHDVEGWRMHYALTCRMWLDRLTARKDDAIRLVGEDKYRIYVAYLAGCALAFERGTARLFQTLASKTAKRPSPLPPTRADLYK